ncbi:hypothetical protein KAJ87_01615 [Candidatus Pacearchaeota archaeon]|nr:hypothetical protein [Candidatus Pacearchaeota archaeon]
MGFKLIISKYGLAIVLAFISAMTGCLSFFPNLIRNEILKYLLPLFFLLGFILEIIRIVATENKPVDISLESKEELRESIKQDTQKTVKTYSDNVKRKVEKFNKEKLSRYDSTELLVNLVKNNYVSIKEVEKILPNEQFISVFCYPTGGPTIPKDARLSRLYPQLFSDLGFVRLGANFFIIPERNLLPKELRGIDVLTNHIKEGIIIYSNEEWKNNLTKINSTGHKIMYRNWKDKENPLKYDFLVYKINMTDLKHVFIKESSFTNDFLKELASVADIRAIRLNEVDKANIKDFILKSSLNILILDLYRKEKDKILSLEKKFKEDLGVDIFCDYANEEKKDIVKILKTKFDDVPSKKYAKLIFERSKKYKEELSKLGII